MKISGNQVESVLRLYTEKMQSGEKKKKYNVEKEKQDTVTFSSQVGEAKELVSRYRELPEIREGMVENIKEQLKKGGYRVEGREVARKMIQREAVDFLLSGSEFD
ncbi:MAG: flagellar biosynthesis anti-sigma factor FlgM [Candidatus Caldatribacteriaceae bacterium]